MAVSTNRFSPWDYVVFTLSLVISAGIGVFYGCTGGRQKTTSEFLMADRQMSIFPVSLSMLASFMSAITLLGTPAEIYVYGTQYWMIWLGYCIMIPLAAHVFLPVFFKLKIISVFEYLELRFSKGVRTIASVVYIIQMILYMAIVLYTPSLALNVVTGLNVWASVFSVGLVCTFYTALGGMKAVMWTDVFQIVLMFAGLFAVLIQGSLDQEGFSGIWQYMEEGERIEFFNFDPSPFTRHTIWSLVFGGCFTWLSTYGTNQAQVQRALCVRTLREAQIAYWVNLLGLTALLTICSLCGMVVYAEYRDCDPIKSDRIAAMDQLLPLYVMDRLAVPGVPGLFTACLFSGALSTISSGLNSLSAVTLQDLVRGIWFKNMSESRATLVGKLLAILYGVIMIALTFVASQLGGVLQAALGLFGMIGGPLLGLYTLGILFPWSNYKGGYVGLLTGLLLTLWLGIGAQVFKPSVYKPPISVDGCVNLTFEDSLISPVYQNNTVPSDPHQPGYLKVYETSYMWYSSIALTTVIVVGLIVSFATGANVPSEVDPRLINPLLYNMCCCLPTTMRQKLRCNVLEIEEDGEKMKVSKDSLDIGYLNPAAEKYIDVSYPVIVQYESSI